MCALSHGLFILSIIVMKLHSSCQIKFAFDISPESVLAWYEYFGWDDEYDMLNAFFKTKKLSTLHFSEVDMGGAKMTVVFETTIDPQFFLQDFIMAEEFLLHLEKNPIYNPCPDVFNNMLDILEEEGIFIKESEPDSSVFRAYNRIKHGFESYKEHLKSIKASETNNVRKDY